MNVYVVMCLPVPYSESDANVEAVFSTLEMAKTFVAGKERLSIVRLVVDEAHFVGPEMPAYQIVFDENMYVVRVHNFNPGYCRTSVTPITTLQNKVNVYVNTNAKNVEDAIETARRLIQEWQE